MSTKPSLLSKVDFAGKHGTIWGALNLWLTTVSVTTWERVFFNSPWYLAAATAGGGFVLTLFFAVILRRTPAPGTVLYHLTCWAGAGTWAAWMLSRGPWTFADWGKGVTILAGATLALGFALALFKEDHPIDHEPAATEAPAPELDIDGMTQGERNSLAAIWAERIDRLSGNPKPAPPAPARPGQPAAKPKPWASRVELEGIARWKSGAGYTIEGTFTSGAWGLPQLQGLCETLAGEANLPWGCHITAVEPGGEGRRAFHLKVNTKNMLLEDQPFPVTGGPWTANGGTPVAVDQTGEWYPLWFPQKNVALYAAPGGGKTGGMQTTTCALALTADVVTVGIDTTGGELATNAQNAFNTGRAQHPIFSVVARTYDEAEKLARALVRMNHARKSAAYDYLKRRENVTILPIGAKVRRDELPPAAQAMFPLTGDDERIVSEVICVCDEPREFTARNGVQDIVRRWIMTGMAEARAGRVRYLLGFLGSTDAHVAQSIQNMIHTNAAGVLANDGEYAGVFGQRSGVKASSFPDKLDGSGKVPGIFFAAADPGAQPKQIRFFGEITPAVFDQVAIRASEIGTLPELDYVTEMAANGFLPDGSPWPCKKGSEMEEGDRWFWRDYRETARASRPAPAPATETTLPVSSPAPRSPMATMEEIRAKAAAVEKAVERRIEEVTSAGADDVDEAELAAIVERWIASATEEAPAPDDEPWRDRVLREIRKAGAEGLQASAIIDLAGVDRAEVYRFLARLVKDATLWKPRGGFYAFPADER